MRSPFFLWIRECRVPSRTLHLVADTGPATAPEGWGSHPMLWTLARRPCPARPSQCLAPSFVDTGGIRLLNLTIVVFSWIVRGGGRRRSSVDSVAGNPDNACRGGPVRECPVRLCRGEVSPCQGGAESARPEHCRQRTRRFPWIETARDSCINRHTWRNA